MHLILLSFEWLQWFFWVSSATRNAIHNCMQENQTTTIIKSTTANDIIAAISHNRWSHITWKKYTIIIFISIKRYTKYFQRSQTTYHYAVCWVSVCWVVLLSNSLCGKNNAFIFKTIISRTQQLEPMAMCSASNNCICVMWRYTIHD